VDFLAAVATGDLTEIEKGMDEVVKASSVPNAPKATPKVTAAKMEEKTGGLVSDSAAGIYVETVDFCLSIACSIFAGSDSTKPYEIPQEKKAQYQKIAAQYFDSIDYQANPGTFFVFATIVIIAGPAWKAWNDRKERLRVSAFASARKAAQKQADNDAQNSLFTDEDLSALRQPPKRKRFEHDEDGFYLYSAPETGAASYLKKEDRTEAVSSQVAGFYREFEAKNGRKPTNKQTYTYLLANA